MWKKLENRMVKVYKLKYILNSSTILYKFSYPKIAIEILQKKCDIIKNALPSIYIMLSRGVIKLIKKTTTYMEQMLDIPYQNIHDISYGFVSTNVYPLATFIKLKSLKLKTETVPVKNVTQKY